MRKPFLELLAQYLVNHSEISLDETLIILPNRRAGLFLQRHLARHSASAVWMPEIWSITDFVNELSGLSPVDPVDALFMLYDIYREEKSEAETLDDFYYWGEIMITDFDEIDKYLVDPVLLFRNIRDLKEIEDPLAGLEDWQIHFIRQFWEGFHEGKYTSEKKQFLENWELLPVLYNRFRDALIQSGQAYPGLQYREICRQIENGELDLLSYKNVIVAGFNALNGCEKRIFSWLHRTGSRFFWDFDQEYVRDHSNEAGRFMRENLEKFPPGAELESFQGLSKDPELRIFELPTDILQAKTVRRIIQQIESEEEPDCTDLAVVLCDEEILMPVLLSLPGTQEEVNVTMGYPLGNTPLAGFIDSLLRMQKNIRRTGEGKLYFFHSDVKSLLLHPYMFDQDHEGGNALLEKMSRENLIQVEHSLFGTELEKLVFRVADGPEGLIKYLREIFHHILEDLLGVSGKVLQELNREFLSRILIHLNKLEDHMAARPEVTQELLERLFKKIVAGLRVPFEGEPLSGLQVMGILESRLLDFRHVILLSMNEEVMPASQFRQSYMPYSLRLAFGMPSREDMDAIYAYYFYRLIQRAEHVDLLFNSTSEGVRTGEMSRYLYQLVYSKGIEVTRPGMDVVAREKESVDIPHNEEISQKLMSYATKGEGGKYLSPSAINTYIDCSLKFYLRYLAGLGEPDDVHEEIDAAGFGTIVHDSLKILYDEIAASGKGSIEPMALETVNRSHRVDEVLHSVFMQHHFSGRKYEKIEGRNIILLKVMAQILHKIIATDIGYAPFSLVSSEKSMERELMVKAGDRTLPIRVGGKIDRVDRVAGQIRVIDYKTGSASHTFASLESLFKRSLSNRNSAALQTLLYAWLVSPEFPDEQISPGLYVIKALYDQKFDAHLSMGAHRQKVRIDSFSPLEDEFIERLGSVLGEMFDPAYGFVQTENESKCRYCDFASICNRNTIE